MMFAQNHILIHWTASVIWNLYAIKTREGFSVLSLSVVFLYSSKLDTPPFFPSCSTNLFVLVRATWWSSLAFSYPWTRPDCSVVFSELSGKPVTSSHYVVCLLCSGPCLFSYWEISIDQAKGKEVVKRFLSESDSSALLWLTQPGLLFIWPC